MQILGVGLSKTGTTSLHRALGMLGYKSLHYDDQRMNDILDGSNSKPDFRLYDDVDAVLDIPTACFYEELLVAYPNCKCILTVRDEESWWKSIRSHYAKNAATDEKSLDPFKRNLRNFVYGSATAHEVLYRKRYREHNQRVLDRIAPDRLLVLEVGAEDAWEKLCGFLGTGVPDIAFPHQNRRLEESAAYRDRAVEEILQIVPQDAALILVDQVYLDYNTIPRRIIPFLERDGFYWGLPADDDTAVRELVRLQAQKPSHLVFLWPAFWWLDHYSEFRDYLKSHFHCVCQTDRIVAFDLES